RAQVVDDLAFSHDLLQESVLRSLPRPVARLLHGRAARLLEAERAPASLIAHHWHAAAEVERALPHYLQAAERALAAGAPEGAGPGAGPRHGRAAGARRRAAGRPARGRRRLARRSARAPPRAGNGLPTPFQRPLHRLREPHPEPLAPPCDFTGASEEKTHASPASPPRPWWQRGAAPLAARRVARAAGPGRAPDSLHYRLEPHDAVAGPDARWGRAPGRRR